MKLYTLLLFLFVSLSLTAQRSEPSKFKQLDESLPTPNSYRTASGAPGHEYWQTSADYIIEVAIDDDNQSVTGNETITFHNESPDNLEYIWLQLDQNVRSKESQSHMVRQHSIKEKASTRDLNSMAPDFEGGFKIMYVTSVEGEDLPHIINNTMMRVDLPEVLKSGASVSLKLGWSYNINNRMEIGGRSGYEYFKKEDNYLYTIAQFFPRMCMYNDVYGWQNKQFLGRGEFTLIFGDYDVKITVPSDHYVASTGELQNMSDVLSQKEIDRYNKAKTSFEQPVIIVTEKEARKNEKSKASGTKTWHFKAKKVRDFAFASSRKFIWDAMAVKQTDGTTVMAMSMYPKEGNPLWEQYSTKVVAHTLKWYSHYTFPYPYPVAWSIHAARIGMEYPMICFNFGRPEKDGTYAERTKYGMIGVIIHEVGHNYFPMIINSDERQWTWMDEGLNTFLQYLTEQQLERNYPSRRGPAQMITSYMGGDKNNISPIMTNSESIHQFGPNAYGKPATALNILRETVMGRELFDHAFKTYSNRWMFKHPTPADFFRTMEDASAVDLDWFWRGWFYTTQHCDISLKSFEVFELDSKNPIVENSKAKIRRKNELKNISEIRNQTEIKQTQNEIDPTLNDFYTTYDPLDVTSSDQRKYKKYADSLNDKQKNHLKSNLIYHQMKFANVGGLVMPVILQFIFEDGSTEDVKIPAEIWAKNDSIVTKTFAREKRITEVILDPYLETADVDRSNNHFPPRIEPSKFEVFKRQQKKAKNPMQEAKSKRHPQP